MINNSKPYFRKDTSTLLVLSAATALVLLASPVLPLSNPLLLLQPVQAQTNLSFRTPIPANGTSYTGQDVSITFDAQGEKFISTDRLEANGTFQITDTISGQVSSSDSISRVQGCCLSNPSNGDTITIFGGQDDNTEILTSCSTSANNNILVQNPNSGAELGSFSGPVECSVGGGATTTTPTTPTTQSSMTGTAHDSDGDGIPDSSDKCLHNSYHRCFKEDTTTQQQSSSNRTGNQTR